MAVYDESEQQSNFLIVGRQPEKLWFQSQLEQKDFDFRVLNIYGTGGIGKSTLLEYFRLVAEKRAIPFILLDSRDFFHTPTGFTQKLLETLSLQSFTNDKSHPIEAAFIGLNYLAEEGRFILVIDTYEEMRDMDLWLCTNFLPRISDRALLILSGRNKLSDEWASWSLIKNPIFYMPVKAFDFGTCADYAAIRGEHGFSEIEHLYAITHGHPLTLSLFMQQPEIVQEFYDNKSVELADTLKKVSSRWLREIPNPGFQSLVEAASIIRIFNQENLEFIMQTPITSVDFDRLTSLSFVRRSSRGWFIHDGLRKALLLDFRLRKPRQFQHFQVQSMVYLYQLFETTKSEEEKALILFDLIYLMRGQSTVRATFMDESEDSNYYFKTLHADSIEEMKEYMQKVLGKHRDAKLEYVDPRTLKRFTLQVTYEYIKKAYSMINSDLFLPLGDDVIRLLINDKGEAGGLIVFLPIHSESLSLLKENPCTRNYFATLNDKQLKELETPPYSPAGWFLYHIDLKGDSSPASRQLFFQTFMKLLIQGGLFIISSPLDYYIKVNKELGFKEVPEAGHYEFGEEFYSKTLELDLRGDKLSKYIQNMLHAAGVSFEQTGMSLLTRREREVAYMLMECETNIEIAAKLHISEITVKKHLSQVYKKMEVKNRADFLKKLMKMHN